MNPKNAKLIKQEIHNGIISGLHNTLRSMRGLNFIGADARIVSSGPDVIQVVVPGIDATEFIQVVVTPAVYETPADGETR